MKKLTVEKKSTQNKYLHRAFHISCDLGLSYIASNFGAEGVKEYLTLFAHKYYSPLIEAIRNKGLAPIKEHLEKIYEAEEASDVLLLSMEKQILRARILKCPGIEYMKLKKHNVSCWYIETTRTLYQAIAREAGIDFVLNHYDTQTGAAEFYFRIPEQNVFWDKR